MGPKVQASQKSVTEPWFSFDLNPEPPLYVCWSGPWRWSKYDDFCFQRTKMAPDKMIKLNIKMSVHKATGDVTVGCNMITHHSYTAGTPAGQFSVQSLAQGHFGTRPGAE